VRLSALLVEQFIANAQIDLRMVKDLLGKQIEKMPGLLRVRHPPAV
jgi:hypothetical protein